MAQAKRYRLMYKFWLNINKREEQVLAATCEQLKRERSYARTIREGIELIVSLRERRLDVLLKLFPWVAEALNDGEQAQPQPSEKPSRNEANFAAMEAKLDQLRELLMQGEALPPKQPKALSSGRITPSLDALGAELELKQARRGNENPNYNLLISLASLKANGAGYAELAPEVIAYGIERGKIPSKYARPSKPQPSGNPRKLDGADVPLTTPDFDDLDLGI